MYAVLNMHWEPSKFADLPQAEKAFVIASINKKMEVEKQKQKQLKKSRKR